MYQPLADKIRPTTMNDVFGQEHILGEHGILRRIVESGKIPNMVFYGPSGTGKTTVANIIANQTNRKLYQLNATTASTADIKSIFTQIDINKAPNGVLLYLDEIQSFNKKQQQTLLEYIENGKITLIASTTENPYFYVFNALLSRSLIFEFKQLDDKAILQAIKRAIQYMEEENGLIAQPEPGVLEHMASACGGDTRKALNAIEVLFSAGQPIDGKMPITLDDAKMVTQKSAMRYNRGGDEQYDAVSALMKSIRGSDPDAAVFYLAKCLEADDLPGACRRILCSASEDVGLAYPMAIAIVKACVDSALQLGMPEARLPLSEAVIFLATCPKSNSAYNAINTAMRDIEAGKGGQFPRHLQNTHADTTAFKREQGYKYPHDYTNHWVQQQYLPDDLRSRKYYQYGNNKTEQAAEAYWKSIKG